MKPVYSDIATEYGALRGEVGLLDYAGAGLFRVAGPGAPAFLGTVSTRNVDFLLEGQISTALVLRDDGTIVAEVLIHCRGTDYLVEVWPAQRDAAAEHLAAAAARRDNVTVDDLSESTRIFGLEGPASFRVAQKFLPFPIPSMAYRTFADAQWGDGVELLISRTGVSGEYGYKLHVPAAAADAVRDEILGAGAVEVGKDALDICRMEMRFANLEGESGDEPVTPFDLGLQWMVDFGQDFTGKESLLAAFASGLERQPVCWVGDETLAEVPAAGAAVAAGGAEIGQVVHAVRSPQLARIIGTARVNSAVAASGMEFEIAGVAARTISAPYLVASSFSIPLE